MDFFILRTRPRTALVLNYKHSIYVRKGFDIRPLKTCLNKMAHHLFSRSRETPENTYKRHSLFSKRQALSAQLKRTYPDRVPVIMVRVNKETPLCSREKFLAPSDISFAKFQAEIRKHIPGCRENQAIYILFRNMAPPPQALMSQIYDLYGDDDGLLYAFYSYESTFG